MLAESLCTRIFRVKLVGKYWVMKSPIPKTARSLTDAPVVVPDPPRLTRVAVARLLHRSPAGADVPEVRKAHSASTVHQREVPGKKRAHDAPRLESPWCGVVDRDCSSLNEKEQR